MILIAFLLFVFPPTQAQWERIIPGTGALELSKQPSANRAALMSDAREAADNLDFFATRSARLSPEIVEHLSAVPSHSGSPIDNA